MKTFKLLTCLLAFFYIQNILAQSSCTNNSTTLCLIKNRFQIEVNWQDNMGNLYTIDNLNQSGDGQSNLISDDTGTFWLFSDKHHELLVKVLDGCAVNNRYWVFSASTTNVEHTIKVTDLASGQVKEYFNPYGNPANPITDVSAFDTCAIGRASIQKNKINKIDMGLIKTNKTQKNSGLNSCVADSNTLCLHNNRFSVNVEWVDFQNNNGSGVATNITDQSGHFWFFSSDNIELLVNIYNGESVNGAYWVFFSAISNIEYSLTVTDHMTNKQKTYMNQLGNSSVFLDNQAFGYTKVPIFSYWGLIILLFMSVLIGTLKINAIKKKI